MSAETFTQLVDAHYEPLYRFALSLARREADACDLVQQTFFVWARSGHTLRDRSKAKTWLFTTLYREFLRGRRREQRFTKLEDLPPDQQDPPAEWVDHVRRLDGRQVMEVLQEVDETFRVPLTLFYLQHFKYHEIAEALDVPLGTVMSRLSRGKAQLRTLLARRVAGATANHNVVNFPVPRRSTGS
jgi:RNA polymerase sigma-70 factor (ECF subfamily)